jgi:N-acetylglucosaminyldiphosphoundecaprenol N-acetyl-beta-D-mannosaminyltransferase
LFNLIDYSNNTTKTLLEKIHSSDSLKNAVKVTLSEHDKNRSVLIVSFINAHAMNLAQSNQEFYKSLMESHLLFRDGIGMKILLKSASMESGFNANGTDLIPEILTAIKGEKLALIGSTRNAVGACKSELEKDGHLIVLHEDGFQGDEYYIHQLVNSNAEVVLLGMGMPRQEVFANKLSSSATKRLFIINGGAIIDFISGTVPRAPFIFRRFGCEWLYRLFIEPKRLWRRYINGNVRFLIGVFLYFFSVRK